MQLKHIGLNKIEGSLVVMDDVDNASYEEMVEIDINGDKRIGRVVQIDGRKVVVQVFEGTRGISLENTVTTLTGHPMEMPLAPEILGRVFDGLGRPIDGLGEIYPVVKRNVNGQPMNRFQEFILPTI